MASPDTHGFDPPASWRELDVRLTRIERHLGLEPLGRASPETTSGVSTTLYSQHAGEQDSSDLEASIGEFGLAWIGSVVFFLGVVFLITYTFSLGHPIAATFLGYSASAGLYFASYFWKSLAPHLSRILTAGSLLLVFYTTMRLHFFSPDPLIDNAYFVLGALLAVVAFQLWLAARRGSQALAGVGILLGMVAALLIDRTHVELPIVAALAAAAVYVAVRHDWMRLLNVSIVSVYTAHLLWLLNNPIAGHPVQAAGEHQYNVLYLFLYAGIFSLPLLVRNKTEVESISSAAPILLNCLGFSMVVALAALTHFQKDFPIVFIAVFGLLLTSSITHWVRTGHQLGAAIYACFGFMALSISIYGYAAIPSSFLWLSLQSLLVVSIALWFRSKVLVVVNSVIYVGILIAYFVLSPSSHAVNFSFALVALASARVMNWQKERLTLQTEILRNVYLAIAFVLVFYGLYQSVPSQYVTLSWTLTAGGYFLLSYLLKSGKYRLMAISAMLVTVLYLFLVDLASLDPRFRVVAFLFLGLIAVMISLYYTRIRKLLH